MTVFLAEWFLKNDFICRLLYKNSHVSCSDPSLIQRIMIFTDLNHKYMYWLCLYTNYIFYGQTFSWPFIKSGFHFLMLNRSAIMSKSENGTHEVVVLNITKIELLDHWIRIHKSRKCASMHYQIHDWM